MALKGLRSADPKFKDTVFGFIRELQNNNNVTIIPVMIKYLCFSYYYLLKEKFATKHGDHIQLDSTKNEISITSSNCQCDNSGYGLVEIDSQDKRISKYAWTICIKGDLSTSFGIGISSNCSIINKNFASKSNGGFCYSWRFVGDSGYMILIPKIGDKVVASLGKTYPKNSDDEVIIKMMVDVESASASLFVDGKYFPHHSGIMLKDIKYRLAISMQSNKQRITIQQFTINQ